MRPGPPGGLLALGAFIAAVLWAGWNGGYVGGWTSNGLDALVGSASYALPAALGILGALMVARSDLVEVRPFRTGMIVLFLGLMLTLGTAHGGYLGTGLGGGLGSPSAGRGRDRRRAALLAGALLLTAPPRARSSAPGRAAHGGQALAPPSADSTALRVIEGEALAPGHQAPPVDVVNAFPDIVSETEPPPLLIPEPEADEQESLFDVLQGGRLPAARP